MSEQIAIWLVDDGPVMCSNGYCDRPAVAAVHNLGPHSTTVLVRTDHLTPQFVNDWRCLECVLNAIQDHIATRGGGQNG